MTVWVAIGKAVICSILASTSSTAATSSAAATSSTATTAVSLHLDAPPEQTLHLSIALTPMLIDYELPGHPNTKGRGHVGTIGRGTLVWTHDRFLTIEAGVLFRIPFAHNFTDELGALPVLALELEPFGESTRIRFGSLDDHHGYHPAIVDEDRYAYGRNYEELYNRSIVPAAHRDLGGDPFMPAENGAQIKFANALMHAELFLDWQLLETDTHREKFAFGVLGGLTHPYADLDVQYRLVHYGGELFTKTDPIRFAQLDPVRQPTTFAITAKLKSPALFEFLRFEVPLAYVHGHVIQMPGAAASSHSGVELGADSIWYSVVRLGWRLWLPQHGEPGFLGEDGDPVYWGRRSQRARLVIADRYGFATLSGRLDLIFMEGASKVQYETVSALEFRWDPSLKGRRP